MILTPRQIIFYAVCNYIPAAAQKSILDEFGGYRRKTDAEFLKVIGKHFNFYSFRDRPFIPEDKLLYSYLIYETRKTPSFDPQKAGTEIKLRGELPKRWSILKYEKQVIIPQEKLVQEARDILSKV